MFNAVRYVQAVVPSMKANGGGTIVFVSSAVVFAGMIGYSQYAPSKFALRGLTDCLRNELVVRSSACVYVLGVVPLSLDLYVQGHSCHRVKLHFGCAALQHSCCRLLPLKHGHPRIQGGVSHKAR